jgi:O-antigen/teichoic acid export membrane protein
VLAPFVVRSLGDEGYGYWALILTATSYFLRLDLGIQSAVGQYISRHLADGDGEQLNDKTNSALTVLLILAAAILGACAAGSYAFPSFFRVAEGSAGSVRAAFVLMGAAAAAKLPFSVFQAMLVGRERFDILSGVTVGVRIVNALLVVWTLKAGNGPLGLAVVMASTQFCEGAILVAAARRAVPQIRIRLFHFRAAAFRELFAFGAFNFLINLAAQLGNGFWAVILARVWGPGHVTGFSIGYEVIPYLVGVANAATLPLLHGIIPLDVRGDGEGFRRMYVYGTRYFTAFICAMGVNLLLLGERFIGLWMGEKWLADDPYGSSGTVLVLLALANIASHSSAVAQQILFARRKNRLFALMTSLQTLAIVGLALVLVPRHGILGMAVAMLLPLAGIEGGVIPFLAAVHARAQAREYWTRGILPNLMVSGAVFAAGTWALDWLPGDGWWGLILAGACVTAAQAAGTWSFILTREDRARLTVTLRARWASFSR